METRRIRGLAAATALVMAGCGQIPGTTGTGTGIGTAAPSAITGTIVKQAQPLPGATVVLLHKVGNDYQTAATTRTDSIGAYRFDSVPAGLYRVAFDRATPAERRQAGRTVLYSPGVDTYGYLSTDPFTLDAGGTRQTPQLDVAWMANLEPPPDTGTALPVTFHWAPAAGARSYKVRIADASNNTVATSPSLSATTRGYTWDGTVAGKRVADGTYYWSVNTDLPQGFGGTNVSPIILR